MTVHKAEHLGNLDGAVAHGKKWHLPLNAGSLFGGPARLPLGRAEFFNEASLYDVRIISANFQLKSASPAGRRSDFSRPPRRQPNIRSSSYLTVHLGISDARTPSNSPLLSTFPAPTRTSEIPSVTCTTLAHVLPPSHADHNRLPPPGTGLHVPNPKSIRQTAGDFGLCAC